MKNKVLIILAGYFLVLTIGVFSCDNCGPFKDRFKVIALDGHNYSSHYSDISKPKLVLSDIVNDSVDYNKYSIQIRSEVEFYFSMIKANNLFTLMNTAYACDPAEPSTDEKIDSIIIICNKDFDINHPQGVDLSPLFDIVVYDDTNYLYSEKFDLSEYLISKPDVPNEMTLILKSPPEETTTLEFMVKYYQDGIDYDYFEFTTNPIVIRKE